MKLIRLFTRYENMNLVRERLFEAGAPGISIVEAKGIGKPLGQMRDVISNKPTDLPQFKQRILVEVVVDDESVEDMITLLKDTCQTGRLGDGKIFILPVDDAVRVRTGDRGDSALY